MKTLIFLIFALFPLAPISHGATAVPFAKSERDLLFKALARTDWSRTELTKLFAHPKVKKLPDLIYDNLLDPVPLTHKRYQHYDDAYSIFLARKFKSKWGAVLKKAQAKFGVDEEMLIAILLVETSFGEIAGDQLLVAVFASIYVDAEGLLDTPVAEDEAMREKITRKKTWALHELKSLLHMGKRYGADLYTLRGSYAGAFGMPQFLPSSYLKWSVPQRGRGRANLFTAPDAIYSVGNYLKAFGYRKGGSLVKNRKAVWYYNHSDVYVDTIYSVVNALKKT